MEHWIEYFYWVCSVYTLFYNLIPFQFNQGYQATVGVDYGFKIHAVKGLDCTYSTLNENVLLYNGLTLAIFILSGKIPASG